MAEYHLSVRDWPRSEQPREKLAAQGATQLSSAELLAILLRVGSQGEDVLSLSQRLLVKYGGLTGLSRISLPVLEGERGLGPAKAVTVKAALELGRRLMLDPGEQRLQVRSPLDVADLLMLEMVGLDQECLRTVLLNTKSDTGWYVDVACSGLGESRFRPLGPVLTTAPAMRRTSMHLSAPSPLLS